jgi:SagB-type dehydrogenase family enzyme
MTRKRIAVTLTAVMVASGLAAFVAWAADIAPAPPDRIVGEITLPQPQTDGEMSLEKALAERRSIREYHNTPLSLAEIGQLLWAAQGITDRVQGFRTAPSAGATYPLELYIATHDGLYQYAPRPHSLQWISYTDRRSELARIAVNQDWIADAAAIVVVSADFSRTTGKYGERGIRYVHFEAGHAAQNLLLQATASGLGATPVGAFDDSRMKELFAMPENESPLYLIAIGHPRQESLEQP